MRQPAGLKRVIMVPRGAHIDSVKYKKFDLDRDLQNGPLTKRRCTDCLCALIFLALILAYCYCFWYGVRNGKPQLLVTPFDSDGFGCGLDKGYENTKFLYFWKVK